MSPERDATWSGRKLLVWVTTFVVCAWLASLLFVPLVASKYYGISGCSEQSVTQEKMGGSLTDATCEAGGMTAHGAFGDSFGAVNALFSGLALAGVVLTLFLHSEGARRTAKPFVIPRMLRGEGDGRVSIQEPARADAIVRLPLHVAVPLHNSSEYPALNIDLSLQLEGVAMIGKDVTDLPLAAKDVADCVLKIDIVGEEAKAFEQKVSDVGVTMVLRVAYDSVEGVRWYSEAKYLIRTNPSRSEDRTLLQHAIDGRMADATRWTAETVVDLEFSTVSGSWKYGEVGS